MPVLRSLLAPLLGLALVLPAHAAAAGPGSWVVSGVERPPAGATTGIAGDGTGARFVTGGTALLRTDARLATELTLRAAIPGELVRTPAFTGLGDPGWTPAARRLVAPLLCGTGAGADCGRGGLALFDRDLNWKVGVTLDAADGPAARWAAPSPDGALVWTSAGPDLVAYRVVDLVPANATLTGGPVRAAVRLPGAAPPGTVTGGAFWDGRLYLAVQSQGTVQLWSADVAAAAPQARLEAEREVRGTSAGLDAGPYGGGLVHWLIAPPADGSPATYGPGPALLALVPAGDGALRVHVDRAALRTGRPALLSLVVTQSLAGVSAPLAGVRVATAGAAARTDENGRAELRVRPRSPGTLVVRAAAGEIAAAPVAIPVLPPIGLPLAGVPSAAISAGGPARRVRANALLDCSGSLGCESPRRTPRPRGCLTARPGADVRVVLSRRPARSVDVLVQDARGATVDGGRAAAQGRNALGWRFPVRRGLPARGRLTVVVVYPDLTGAITVLRLRRAGC